MDWTLLHSVLVKMVLKMRHCNRLKRVSLSTPVPDILTVCCLHIAFAEGLRHAFDCNSV